METSLSMSDQNSQQPTVLVKKADGSTVRMTLAEFREFKKQEGDSSQLPATTTPVSDVFVNEAAAEAKSKPQILPKKSLLDRGEEEVEEDEKELPISASLSSLEDPAETRAAEIVKKIPFSYPPEVKGRLISLLVSKIKEVRTVEQFRSYAVEVPEDGGLGLSEEQVDTLLSLLYPGKKINVAAEVRSRAGSGKPVNLPPPMQMPIAPAVAPKKTPPAAPALPQTRDFKYDGSKVVMRDVVPPPPQRVATQPVQRVVTPIVSLAAPSESRTVGPVGEIRSSSLVDFQRLGVNANERAKMMIQKFETLKHDSYVLFLQGKEAWTQSPLYQMYLDILRQSLQERKNIKEILQQNSQGLTLEDITAIVEINSSLG